MDLSQLFNRYGSDKDINGYTPLYCALFNHLKNEKLNLLEVGIGTMIPNVPSSMVGYGLGDYKPGASLRAWRDFFVNANIIGVDIQPDTQFTEDRIQTFLCNSTNNDEVKSLMSTFDTNMDIIIDDGSHHYAHQLQTLENFFPYLKDDGIYVIEDIPISSELSKNPFSIQKIVGENPFFFTGLKNNMCVILKHPLKSIFAEKNNW